jgi:hypothetical protein
VGEKEDPGDDCKFKQQKIADKKCINSRQKRYALLTNCIWFFRHGSKHLKNGSEKKGKSDSSLFTTRTLFDVPTIRFIP